MRETAISLEAVMNKQISILMFLAALCLILTTALHGDALSENLVARYKVSPKDVTWVRDQGIPDSDLGEVFSVASEAQVSLRRVVKLRVAGESWREIRAHLGLDERDPVVVQASPAPVSVHVVAPMIVPPPFILWRVLLWPFFLLRHVR
jgi:hypothetical protein